MLVIVPSNSAIPMGCAGDPIPTSADPPPDWAGGFSSSGDPPSPLIDNHTQILQHSPSGGRRATRLVSGPRAADRPPNPPLESTPSQRIVK